MTAKILKGDRSKYNHAPRGRVAVCVVEGITYRLVPGKRYIFVSECGKVYSTTPFKNKGGHAFYYKSPCGYTMSSKHQDANDRNGNTAFVHRLVAMAWLGTPENFLCLDVNHKDGNKDNNHASNLEWCTRRENLHHAMKNNLHVNPMKPIVGWKEDGSGWYFRSQSEAKTMGFVQANISRAISGERPRANGYYWSEF